MLINTISAGEVKILTEGETEWKLSSKLSTPEPGIEIVELDLDANMLLPLPNVELEFSIPQKGVNARWTPDDGSRLPMAHEAKEFKINLWIPIVSLFDVEGKNRLTFAFSETLRTVSLRSGATVMNGDCYIQSCIRICGEAGELSKHIRLLLRLDSRQHPFYTAVRSAANWYDDMPGLHPASIPSSAYTPFYSTWYGYWSSVSASELERECALARDFGIKGLLLDDGWHTAKNEATYAAGGDWEPALSKFPNMREHVAKIHSFGMKYISWIGTPIVGEESIAAKRFAGKFLRNRGDFSILDPRFPEVRSYLIERLEDLMRKFAFDGFKLDFIEWFTVDGEDPATTDNYVGRDFKSVPLAADALLDGIKRRLSEVNSDVLIEFRQSYIGPTARKYANILRVGDCPADIKANRCGIARLRLTSGRTAVHADMLTWSLQDSPESSALQLLNCLFGTPQISMRLSELPEDHRRMLRFWLGFMEKHRETLLLGDFGAVYPEMSYPLLFAESKIERIISVHCSAVHINIDAEQGKTYYIVNATGENRLAVNLQRTPLQIECYDTFGEYLSVPLVHSGLSFVEVSTSGFIKLTY